MCTDGLKLLGRNDDDLENEIKIVKAYRKGIIVNFGLRKCEGICLKNISSKAKHS